MADIDPKQQAEINKLLKEAQTSLDAQEKLYDKLNQAYARSSDYYQDQVDKLTAINELLDTSITKNELEAAKIEQKLAVHKENLKNLKAGTDAYNDQIYLIRLFQDELQGVNERLQELNELENLAVQSGEKLVRVFSLSGRTFQESLVGRAEKFGQALKESPEKFKESMTKAKPVASFFSGIFDKIVESTIAMAVVFDRVTSQFNASTGAAGEFNSSILAATQGAAALGVGVNEAATAAGNLYTGFADFNLISETSRNEMIKMTAALENVGVSAQTTAENINFLVKGMGMTADEATETQVRLAEFAKGIGVAPAIMADNFKQAQPIMVQYGNTVGNQVFQNLTKQAKATGLAMGELLAITGQFDTFEGAANAAGKLNALLGGNLLNSVELLTASEDKRIMMLRRAIDATGRSFASMNKFEKQSIAAAAGINDMTKAAQLFGTTDAEFEKISEEQASLAEMTAKAQSVQQKLTQAFERFAVAIEPAVNGVRFFVDLLVKVVDNPFGKVVLGFAGAVGAATLAFKLLAPAMSVISLLLPGVGTATSAAIGPVSLFGTASGAASVGVGAFSLALTPVLIAITAVAAAIPITVFAIKELVKTVIEGSEGFASMAESLLKISGSFGTFAISGAAGGMGAAAFATGIASIAAALSDISTDELFALAYFAQGLGSITETSANAFAEAMNQLNTALATANDVGTDTLEKATALVSAINQNQAAFIAPAPTTVATPVTQVVGGGGGSAAGGSQMATVILQLNDREFGRAVVDIMENKVFKLTS